MFKMELLGGYNILNTGDMDSNGHSIGLIWSTYRSERSQK